MQGFAIWMTGTPASGKSKRSRLVAARLREMGAPVQVLESDELRKVLTPSPTYSEDERDWFYDVLVYLGRLFADRGVNVIFDATGNRRRYRDAARRAIEHYAEVYIYCPPDVCLKRDPKDIYKAAAAGEANTVPGIGTAYEPPEHPEITCVSGEESPEESADKIIAWLSEKGWIG